MKQFESSWPGAKTVTDRTVVPGTFFYPGPTEVRREVLEAMLQPMLPHRSVEFETILDELQSALRTIFRTRRNVFVATSSGTGLMEAAVRCAPPGPILALVNGAFAARFADIARACGRDVDRADFEWGSVIDLDVVESRLARRRYAAVTVVHSETSTGALTPVHGLAEIAHDNGALLLCDSVSGIGGIEFDTHGSGADFVFTASQKALALPPGLAFGVASEAMMRDVRKAKGRGRYFNLALFDKAASHHQTTSTPAISLIYAAHRQCSDIVKEGMPARCARHHEMAALTREWISSISHRTGMQFQPVARPGYETPSVSVIRLPHEFEAHSVVRAVRERGFTIGTGYQALSTCTIRIGHMGDHTPRMLQQCLYAIDDSIDSLKSDLR